MAKLVNEGENRILNIWFGSTSPDASLQLGLYTDSSEPAETAVLGDLTEPVGNGYARQTLTRGSWSIAGDLAEYAQQTFTASGGDWGNVYGYFITNGTELLFVEHFSNGPYNVTDGSNVKVTTRIRAA